MFSGSGGGGDPRRTVHLEKELLNERNSGSSSIWNEFKPQNETDVTDTLIRCCLAVKLVVIKLFI